MNPIEMLEHEINLVLRGTEGRRMTEDERARYVRLCDDLERYRAAAKKGGA